VEGAGFEPSVPVLGGSVSRVISLFGLPGIRRRNEGLDSVRLARRGFPQQSMPMAIWRSAWAAASAPAHTDPQWNQFRANGLTTKHGGSNRSGTARLRMVGAASRLG